MSEFEAKLNECQRLLYNEPVVQEYFRLKKIIETHDELTKLDHEIHQHQRLMCLHKDNDVVYKKEKNLYDEKMNQFKSHPLVENYFQVKEEVFSLLNEIKEILE